MSRVVKLSARHQADKDNLYSLGGSHHISLGRVVAPTSEELACLDKSCAPPPVGTGGSKGKGGGPTDYSVAAKEVVENVVGSPRARASRDAYVGSGSRSEESWDDIRANPGLRQSMADEYARLPSYDNKAVKAYGELAKEVEQQYDHMVKSGIKVEFVDYDPYPTAVAMRNDVEAGTIKVMRTDVTGPHKFFTNEQNDKFRAVHDVYGHASTGRGFDRHGERAAYISHREMFRSPDAIRALATETEGQNATVHVTGRFPEQKIALMSDDLVFDSRLASAAVTVVLVTRFDK